MYYRGWLSNILFFSLAFDDYVDDIFLFGVHYHHQITNVSIITDKHNKYYDDNNVHDRCPS